MSAAGPAYGTAASAAAVLLGFILSGSGLGDITIDSPAFADSWIMALGGQLFLGDALAAPEVGGRGFRGVKGGGGVGVGRGLGGWAGWG